MVYVEKMFYYYIIYLCTFCPFCIFIRMPMNGCTKHIHVTFLKKEGDASYGEH